MQTGNANRYKNRVGAPPTNPHHHKKKNEIPDHSLTKQTNRTVIALYQNNKPLTNTEARSAWTPVENTYFHFLTVDLGERKMVRKIATAGRASTNECVTEYIVQYSDDGEMWKSFSDSDGEEQVNAGVGLSSICVLCF